MSNQFPATGAFAPQISFWCQIWQTQLEQSFRVWGFWAQFLPGESASQLAAEAEALKPVVRTTPSRPAIVKSAPVVAKIAEVKPAPKPAAKPAAKTVTKPVLAVATDAPAPKTAPAKKAPRTPVEAKTKTAATKPTMH
jgi:hypothetical protein